MEIPASSPLLPPHHLKGYRFYHPDYNRRHIWLPVVASLMTVLALIVIMVFIIRRTLRASSAPRQPIAAAAPEPPLVPADEITASEAPAFESDEETHAIVPLEVGR